MLQITKYLTRRTNIDKDPARHYYLYAKNHYKEGNIDLDLRKIQSHYCAVPIESLSIRDVNIILQRLACIHIQNEGDFNRFMDYWRDYINCSSFEISVAKACLMMLCLTRVKEIPFPLGEADPSILPLSK